MSEMITTHVSDGYFDGYLAIPKSGEGPSILLIQEIFGVNSHIKKFADKLADEGFVVLAPDLFWRLQLKLISDTKVQTKKKHSH